MASKGYPCFVSVEQDGSGNAWPLALAVSRAIGATKSGAIESSCKEETLIDLFSEQALFPTVSAAFFKAYEILKGMGCSDEALTHELWISKEAAEVFEMMADVGFVAQLVGHSSVR